MKKIIVFLVVFVLLLSGCGSNTTKIEGTQIKLSDNKITINGKEITSDNTQAVYSANDIVFYLAGQDFTYGEGTEKDGHLQNEADNHTVVHITKPGRYVLSGELSLGQIAVDLGKDAETDSEAVVTLILNGVDITCKVAPAIIFYNVYECSNSDEETATMDVDTKNAGANIIIADNTENNINGSYVAKIYKSYELNEDGTQVTDSKKLHKYDGAFYSKMSMNINGGKVIATGNMLDRISGGEQNYAVFSFASRQNGNDTYMLKNSDNKIVGEYAPENAFTYLVIADKKLVSGDYTFWQGNRQLTAIGVDNMREGMPQGERPEKPQWDENWQGTPPNIPDGAERPDIPNGELPQMPNGQKPEKPIGEPPQIPDGMENVTPPNDKEPIFDGNMNVNAETSTTFNIKKGGNQFVNVCTITDNKK